MEFLRKAAITAVFTGIVIFSGCSTPEVNNQADDTGETAEVISHITMIAAGDNLIHDIIYNNARTSGEDDRFNFNPNYALIRPIIKEADIAFVNQETVMGGREIGYSGYPVFNTPQDAGEGLILTGFNVINLASNHSMDKGERAVYNTMNFLDSWRITYLGVFRTEEERSTKRRIVEKNGIKTGFLSYTYGLNGFVLPRDKPWLVGLIDKEVMAREIDDLRPHCDLLVVSMHWGDEFRHTANDFQRDLARFMADRKVDLILGHHPHVFGPVEVIPRPDGGNLTVYYSLGDLLSHTQSSWNPNTIIGALAYIKIKKVAANGESFCTVEFAGVIPTVCHYERGRRGPFAVYPLWDYNDDLASRHFKTNITMDYLNKTAADIFDIRVLDKKLYESYLANSN